MTVLEKADAVGSAWRQHYDRLHLHTDRNHSGLPGLPMPRGYPTYPSRAQVVDYLENYAGQLDIRPVFNAEVSRVVRDGIRWRVVANGEAMSAPIIIVATGIAHAPYRPSWPGMEAFGGGILHSRDYRNPEPFAGKRVLVVGFGNSGGEIALDLAEADVDVTLAVRSPVQVIPRDLLGFRSCPGRSCTGICRRALSMPSTRRCCGLRSAISRSSDCAARPRDRGGWWRRTATYR